MTSLDEDTDVLDVRGAMALLRVGRDAIYTLCARQEIPHRKVGRALRFSRAALVRWLDSCGPSGALKGQ
jgi:excisionase family DNA binding protein